MDELPVSCQNVGGGFGRDRSRAARYFHDSNIRFYGHTTDLSTDVPWDTGRWQMLTVTFDADGEGSDKSDYQYGTLKLYKNAHLIAFNKNHLVYDTWPTVRAGNLGYENYPPFKGVMDEFTIWKGDMNDKEVLWLYMNPGRTDIPEVSMTMIMLLFICAILLFEVRGFAFYLRAAG